jgi:hypothetical protein
VQAAILSSSSWGAGIVVVEDRHTLQELDAMVRAGDDPLRVTVTQVSAEPGVTTDKPFGVTQYGRQCCAQQRDTQPHRVESFTGV